MREPGRTARIGFLLALLSGPGGFRAALAQGTPSRQVEPLPRRLLVLVLPFRDDRLDPEAIFVEKPEPSREEEGDLPAAPVREILSREPELQVMSPMEALADEGHGDETLAMVRGLLHLGQERYRDLRVQEAIPVIRQGIAIAQKSLLDLRAPALVSDLHLVLGLCLVETGDSAAAHQAFREMFRVTPGRRFRSGWFPGNVEAAIRGAARDFLAAQAGGIPLGSIDRLEDLLRRTRAFAVISGTMRRSEADGSPLFSLRVLETSTGAGPRLALAVREDIPWDAPEEGRERLSRALGAWLACTTLPSRRPEVPRLPEVFLDTTGAWSAWLKGPTRRIFHNAGFGVGLSWQVLEGLDIFGGLNVTNSFPDAFGDLLRDFWTVRLSAGVGYSVRFGWGRVYVHSGLLFDYLSDFASTTDPNCKFWPDRPDRCLASRVQHPRWMLGWMVAPGVEVRLAGPLQLMVRVGLGAHFVSSDFSNTLNFPIQVEVGLGYAFPVKR